MKTVNTSQLKDLVSQEGIPCVSIFMPTHRAGRDIRQDPIRLKNLLKQAEDLLAASGAAKETVQSLDRARSLLDDPTFWEHQSDGLALFPKADRMDTFRLPVAFEELVVVNDRPHVKPLLPLLHEDREFYVLALNLNEVQLFRCSRYEVVQMELPGVPTSMAEALRAEVPERSLQFHSETSPRQGDRGAMFHGQGVGTDEAQHKKKIQEFLQMVSRGVDRILTGRNGHGPYAPLVLAGTDYVCSSYRELSRYSPIASGSISGSAKTRGGPELRDRGWAIVQPGLEQERADALEAWGNASGAGLATDKLGKIVAGAYQGRVELLFVAVDEAKWGRYDPQTDRVLSHRRKRPGDEDLLDFAAVHTLRHGGRVFAVPVDRVPGAGAAAAVMRK